MSTISIEKTVEVLLLAVLIWPLARVGFSAPFRRKLRVFPRIRAGLLALLASYAGIVALAALSASGVLRTMVAVAILAFALERWRARPAFGRRRGLPPGSLVLAPMAPWRDHRFYLDHAARYGPVFKMSNYVQPMICVVGLSRARDLLRQHDHSLRVAPLPFSRFIPGGFLRYMAPEPHRMYRNVLREAFSGDVVSMSEPFMARATRTELSRLARASEPRGAGPQPHLLRLVQTIFLRVFFGLPEEAPAATRMRELYGMIDYRAAYRSRPATVRRVLAEMADVLTAQIRMCGKPTSDGPSDSFLRRLVAADRMRASDPTVVGNLIYISQSTASDVSELLTWLLKMLSDHPQWHRRLRDDLDGPGSRSADPEATPDLADRIVSETLRLEQSEYVMRQTLTELQWDDYVIPRGWQIRVCVRESHRDPDIFDAPDVFDPDRHVGRTFGPNEFAPFGIHRLTCLGEHLTRAVARAFVTELVGGYEWIVVEDGSREFGGFHWQPSSRFRVRLEARREA